ncbi:NACHT and WD repeat domain-containing protein [Roseateles sp. PN1]|uniref:NACHT and WD repeat domain-containing protein n=1 Tax=Roseateles sp. PN1 TaxID=3137372 RepID=UPI003138E88E
MTANLEALLAANPFPGLRSFEPNEADRFFGRESQIEALLLRLSQVPLVAVSGASGCGKSSLVKAGLLNELKRRHEQDDEAEWRAVVMRPGIQPLQNLAAVLAECLPAAEAATPEPAAAAAASADSAEPEELSPAARRVASICGQLRMGGMALVELVRRSHLPPGVRLLVVVDQFEELFRFKRMANTEEASAFVKLLLQAAADPASRIRVVLTMRSDTLGGCADFPGLPEAVSAGGYLVPRLTRQQRKDAIVKPIEWRGAQIAPRLVQRLLNDVSSDFDDLPVMQHALSRTWRHWAQACQGSRPIDLDDYEKIGAAVDALSRHADEARLSLGPLGEPGGAVERVFRALTERMAEGTEVRRPIELGQLCAICKRGPAGEAEVLAVVERYRQSDTAFLVPGGSQALDRHAIIDISHESLIRQWQRLRAWVVAEAEAKATLLRLVGDARAHAQSNGELWHGRSLERARDWQQRNHPNAAWVKLCLGGTDEEASAAFHLVQSFLDKSAAVQEKARRQSKHMLWGLRGLAALVTGVSVLAALYGQVLHGQALSREWGAKAILQIVQDPARSAALALAALEKDGNNERAEFAFRRAMAALELARAEQIVDFDAPVIETRYSPDRKRLLVASANTVWILDDQRLMASAEQAGSDVLRAEQLGALKFKLPEQFDKLAKAWLLDDGRVLVLSSKGLLRLLEADGRPNAQQFCASDAVSWVVALNPVKAEMAASCVGGDWSAQLTRWTLGAPGSVPQQQGLLSPIRSSPITALAYSPDGELLAAGDSVGQVQLWRHGPGSEQAWIHGDDARPGTVGLLRHGAAINDLSFSKSRPGLLASAGDDGFARVWPLDLRAGKLMGPGAAHHMKHERSVSQVQFLDRADDKNLLLTVSDWRVNLWSNEKQHEERRHDDWVTLLDASDLDGELLVSASADGTARLWSSRSIVPLTTLRGHTSSISHAMLHEQGKPDGQGGAERTDRHEVRRVITSSLDGTLRIWRLKPPTLLLASKRPQSVFALSPAGSLEMGADRLLMICGESGSRADSAGAGDQYACAFRPLSGSAAQTAIATSADNAVASEHFQVHATKPGDAGARTSLNTSHTTYAARFSADGKLAMVYSQEYNLYADRKLWLLDLDKDGAAIDTPAWLSRSVTAYFDSKRPEFGLLDPSGAISLWPNKVLTESADEAPVEAKLQEVSCGATACTNLALSPDGKMIAAAAGNGVMLWSRAAGKAQLLATLDRHQGDLRDLNFSPDSQRLVTASVDRTARVWDLSDLQADNSPASRELAGGHSSSVSSADFSPDGQFVVTAGADGSIRVWDANSGQEKAALLGRHRGKINLAAFHPDGQKIISVGDDGNALLTPCSACVQSLPDLKQRAKQQLHLTTDDQAWLKENTSSRLRDSLQSGWWGLNK